MRDGTAFRPLSRSLHGVSATSACPCGGGPGLPPSMMNGGRFHPLSPPPLLLTGLHHPLLLRSVTSPSALGGCVCSGAPVHQGGQWEGEEAEVGREARRCWLSWPGGWSLATPSASPRISSILILLPERSDDTGSRLPRWAPPLFRPASADLHGDLGGPAGCASGPLRHRLQGILLDGGASHCGKGRLCSPLGITISCAWRCAVVDPVLIGVGRTAATAAFAGSLGRFPTGTPVRALLPAWRYCSPASGLLWGGGVGGCGTGCTARTPECPRW